MIETAGWAALRGGPNRLSLSYRALGAKREDPSSRKILRILTHGLPWPLF